MRLKDYFYDVELLIISVTLYLDFTVINKLLWLNMMSGVQKILVIKYVKVIGSVN